MSMNQVEMNPNWAQPQQQRKGCGPLSCLVIGCGGMMLLCCGIGAGGIFYVGSWFSEDPATIAAECERIADIDIPADLQPAMSVNMKIPFVGEFGTGVFYTDPDGGSMMLIALNPSVAGAQETEIEQFLRQALQEEGPDQEKDFQAQQSEPRELTVRGKPATFFFSKGTSTATGAKMIEVKGAFEGKYGPTMFYFLGDAEKYDEAQLTEMIESIK